MKRARCSRRSGCTWTACPHLLCCLLRSLTPCVVRFLLCELELLVELPEDTHGRNSINWYLKCRLPISHSCIIHLRTHLPACRCDRFWRSPSRQRPYLETELAGQLALLFSTQRTILRSTLMAGSFDSSCDAGAAWEVANGTKRGKPPDLLLFLQETLYISSHAP